MSETLDRWDVFIAPALQDMAYRAATVKCYARTLPFRPEWSTLAEDELDRAIAEVEKVLSELREAKRIYQSKPTGE